MTESAAPTDFIENTPTVGNEEDTDVATSETTDGPRLFGGLTAAEAGRRSAQKRAERDRSNEASEADVRKDDVLIVRTTVETGGIISKLAKDAKAGNVQAARELRAWLSELPIETDTDLSTLDRKTRQLVLARVLSELESEGDTASSYTLDEQASTTIQIDALLEEEGRADAGFEPSATPAESGLR